MKSKITFISPTSTRTPGIRPRCGKIHPHKKTSCIKERGHSAKCKWAAPIYAGKLRPGETPKEPRRPRGKMITKLDCLQMIEDPVYRARLLEDLRVRKLRPAVECMLWYYAKGKPKEMVEHSGTLSLQQELSALTPEELHKRALDVASMLAKQAPTVH